MAGTRRWITTAALVATLPLTLTADSACTDLPVDVRARSYPVVVTARSAPDRQTTPAFELQVAGAAVVGNMTGFTIGVAGNRLSFWLHAGHDPALVEDLGSNTYLAFSGTAGTTIGSDKPPAITAEFDGWVEHIVLVSPLTGPWYSPQPPVAAKATCESRNHRLTLKRTD